MSILSTPLHLSTAATALLALGAPGFAQEFEQTLVGSDTINSDRFGSEVEIDGEWMVVGARGQDPNGSESGAAYVFRRVGGAWVETQKLVEPELDAFDRYGIAVAISGTRMAVGANLDDDADGDPVGAVYTYALSGSTWVRTGRLNDSSQSNASEFGFGLDLDGGWLAVGAQSTNGGGSAYLYEDVGGWILRHTIDSPAATGTTDFGYSVALSVAANTLAVGAPLDDILTLSDGAVYLYSLGGAYLQRIEMSGPDPVQAKFGWSLDMDGNVLVVGTPEENTPIGSTSGAAYVFRQGAGTWNETQRLVPPALVEADGGDLFARELDLSGERLMISGYRALSDDGQVYVYDDGPAGFELAAAFTDYEYNGQPQFGLAVALDGDRAAVCVNVQATGELRTFDLAGGLLGGAGEIDLFLGGTRLLSVDAGPARAGWPYLILGSRSGTAPGLVLDGLPLPLNPDGYTVRTLQQPNAPPLTNSFGVLDAAGRGFASFGLPPMSNPALAGITAQHAALAIDPVALLIGFTTNALGIELVP